MHIAVCDDNIADRKQTERLLGREADKRKNTDGAFYADYFGNIEALINKPLMYDLYLIDTGVTELNPTDATTNSKGINGGLSLALFLIDRGVTAPIVLCSSKVNYLEQLQALSPCPGNLLHMQKPIKAAELSQMIEHALGEFSKKTPTIELRSKEGTFYVLEDDIIYATTKGVFTTVYLKDKEPVTFQTDMINFYDQIAMYTHMFLVNDNTLINLAYYRKHSHFKIELTTGVTVKINPFIAKRLTEALQTIVW